ncbi:MAG: hypothetical protein OEU40_13135 [Gammaproteobacteria bacterium]|nr:hypothetical protein [Gammaproteobacteria bacterium]
MTLEEFNYIAEFITFIAAIASVWHVGLQISQNAAKTQAKARASVSTCRKGG